jgi:3-methyl-2-oxobutanoate hydroxymethyltransferase
MPKKLTVHDLFAAQREGRQLAEVFTGDPLVAQACEAAGIDILVCMTSDLVAFRKLAPSVFIIAADNINDPAIAGPEAAVSAGFQAMLNGADAVYTGLSLDCVRVMARERIPVVGHVGYVPYRKTWFGKARAVGKTAAEAEQVYRDTMAYQEAGAIGVEMEIVPQRVADEIARRTDILIISMGSGTAGVCQYLFAEDILGTNTGHVPRHAKAYANLQKELERLQQMRVDALAAFKADVAAGGYPAPEHLLDIDDTEFDTFLSAISHERNEEHGKS